jgi:hypothetical protein
MTSEELAAAGIAPVEVEVHEFENTQPQENSPVPDSVPGSKNHEDGELRSENASGAEEDLADVDANVRDLMTAKSSKSYPPSIIFGKSKVTTNMIREYESAGFFPAGDGRASLDEQTPVPEADEIVVFRDFFTSGLRFPCDPLIPTILDKFSVKIHQLSPSSFLELSKFFWIMKTFKCNISVDVFARLFELVIEKDVIKLDNGQYYGAHYACCILLQDQPF